MASNPEQPKADAKKNTARLAKVHRLTPFDDLSLIDRYAARFGLDPDWVYYNTSFSTIMAFAVMWKETDEFNDRFSSIWAEINLNPTKV